MNIPSSHNRIRKCLGSSAIKVRSLVLLLGIAIATVGVVTPTQVAVADSVAVSNSPGLSQGIHVIHPFLPPSGFVLGSSTNVDAAGQHVLYGATSPSANWVVMPWGISGATLPPFQELHRGVSSSFREWRSATPNTTVEIIRQDAEVYIENLTQTGSNLPCAVAGQPNEFDLFVSPNSNQLNDEWRSAIISDIGKMPNLGELGSFTFVGEFRMAAAATIEAKVTCEINQINAGINIILNNTYTKQTLFYQLHFLGVCLKNAPSWCEHAPSGYFWPGDIVDGALVFGYDDSLPSFHQDAIADRSWKVLYIDALERLKTLIKAGSTGALVSGAGNQHYLLDTDVTHWQINSMYIGQAIWGNVKLSTQWRGFIPTVTVKTKT